MSNNILGFYTILTENDFRVNVRLVKYINQVLKHSPKFLLSREIAQDLKAHTEYFATPTLVKIIESELIKLYNDESYTKMSKEDIEIASIEIPGIISFNRDMKISEILQ
jgi:hypothetical protein